MGEVIVRFGFMAPPLAEQLPAASIPDPAQGNADAVTRLSIHGVLTDTEAQRARKRILRSIEKANPELLA